MENQTSTKERIIYQSLKLFSQKGYDGVSMREIAAAVGIKGASIYNHFKGKEEIFTAIFEEMKNKYSFAAMSMNIPSESNSDTAMLYHNTSEQQLQIMAEGIMRFFTLNEFVAMFRRLLVSEQFKSEIAAQFYNEYYVEAAVSFQASIFAEMQKGGDFSGFDTRIMAIHFYSPVFYILEKFDLGTPFEECMELIKKHVHQFCKIYNQK